MPDSNTTPGARDANLQGAHVIVVGAGYLGRVVARQLKEAGARVTGTTRTDEGAEALNAMGIDHRPLLLTSNIRQAVLTRSLSDADMIVYAVSPSEEGQTVVFRDGLLGVAQATNGPFVVVSSTGVYDADDGGWVDETSHTTGIIATTERLLWARPHTAVVRCGGLYGPGRSPVAWVKNEQQRKRFAMGNQLAWMNWVHVEDAASAIILALSHGDGPFNVAHAPSTREDFYGVACEVAGVPELTFRDSGYGLGKRVSSNRAQAVLGWQPRFPTHVEGLRACTSAVVE